MYFNCKVVNHLLKLTGTERRVANAYHRQTNGLTERFNQKLKDSLIMKNKTTVMIILRKSCLACLKYLDKDRYCLKTLEGKSLKQTTRCVHLMHFLDPVVEDNIVDEVEELDNSDIECAGEQEADGWKRYR